VSPVLGREIVDMSGRKVTIPDTITKVVGISPPTTYLLYAIDPTVIGGLNSPLWENERKYLVKGYGKLPVIGGMFGQGRIINQEMLLKVAPDFVLYWAWKDDAVSRKFESQLAQLAVPRVDVRLNSLLDYPAALQFLGDVLGKRERAKQLQCYAEGALAEAKKVAAATPANQRVSVYYAEGLDGLSTERSGSEHAGLIPLAGGVNVHRGEAVDSYGMEKIFMEQLLLYDPEVILVREKTFFAGIRTDPRWQNIRAVKTGRVYLIPQVPFNWFDRPPSFMRLLGVKWLLSLLQPDRYKIDMVGETRTFYQLFLGVELSEKEAREILRQ
jgi:iron complex transport system substrate-binding protein